MASRVEKRRQTAAAPKGAAAASSGADDLQILQPDRQIEIAGETVTVREYRFVEGLELLARAQDFLRELYGLFRTGEVSPSVDDIGALLGRYSEITVDMIAQATGKPKEWVRSLRPADGDLLMVTWWTVNSGFFIQRVMRQAMQERLASRSDGAAHTTSSSPPATSDHPAASQS